MKDNIDAVVKDFEKSGALIYDAILSGDYKTNNKEWNKITRYFKSFERNLDFGYSCIDKLLESNNVVVKIRAAAYCLALLHNVDLAVSILEEIINNPDNGIFRFNAEMTLKVWREQGYLKIYQ